MTHETGRTEPCYKVGPSAETVRTETLRALIDACLDAGVCLDELGDSGDADVLEAKVGAVLAEMPHLVVPERRRP